MGPGHSRLHRLWRHQPGTRHRRLPGPHSTRPAADHIPGRVARGGTEPRALHAAIASASCAEVTANIGYWITPNLKAFVSYNFIYWTNVIRPGDQIDRVVDLSFVPNAPPTAPSGQLRPKPLFNQSDLWVTGLQFGVQWRW